MSSADPLERRRWRRVALAVCSILAMGAAPLACELTTDLDKLRGPTGDGGSGGSNGGPDSETTGSGGTGTAGGQPVGLTLTIPYASDADVSSIHYDGVCKESFWIDKALAFKWGPKDKPNAHCWFAWGAGETANVRAVYGCCEVAEASVYPININGTCVPFKYDGIEYLFAKSTEANAESASIILTDWGHSCTTKAGVVFDQNGNKMLLDPDMFQLNAFKPMGDPPAHSAAGAKGFSLEWSLSLDQRFAPDDHDEVYCTFGVRSVLLGSVDSADAGQLTSSGKAQMSDPSGWSKCVFAPAPDGG